jgi:hypothetical protein
MKLFPLNNHLNTAALTLLAVALISDCAVAGPKVYVGKPCDSTNRPSLAQVDHGALDALLQKYVDGNGLVAYGKWKANAGDVKALDDYLEKSGCVDLRKPVPRQVQVAYWINIYNALTLKAILREYPTTCICQHRFRIGGFNIFKDLVLWVDGTYYSLDDIEHRTLRKMGEPRIHFAIVCGGKGCPPLSNRVYTANGLEKQLVANAQRFFAKPSNFKVEGKTVWTSQLLKWYGSDFGRTAAEQWRSLRPYLPAPENLAWLESGAFTVRYTDYDWTLNDQNPVSP